MASQVASYLERRGLLEHDTDNIYLTPEALAAPATTRGKAMRVLLVDDNRLMLEELISIDPLGYDCVEYQEHLHQGGNSDLDVAIDVEKVKEILTLEDGETDFCNADKGEISGALYIHGYTLGGIEFLSVPAPSVGIDQLLKQNK
jgi:hypothetical protein